MKNCMKGLSVRKVENHCLKWESWVRWNKLQRNPEMLAQLPHSRSHTCSYSRLTPSSSSSELSKMLSKSCREGAKSVTCVRLPEPALPAALSCRTSVGKEARTQGEQAPQLGKRRTDMDWTRSTRSAGNPLPMTYVNLDTIISKYAYQLWKERKNNPRKTEKLRSNYCYSNKNIILNWEESPLHFTLATIQVSQVTMYTPVLVAELKIDMAFFPSGTGVEWPGVVTSLVPNPSSDCVINSAKQNTWTATQSVGYEGEQKELARRMEPIMSSVRNHGLCNQRESKACSCSALHRIKVILVTQWFWWHLITDLSCYQVLS